MAQSFKSYKTINSSSTRMNDHSTLTKNSMFSSSCCNPFEIFPSSIWILLVCKCASKFSNNHIIYLLEPSIPIYSVLLQQFLCLSPIILSLPPTNLYLYAIPCEFSIVFMLSITAVRWKSHMLSSIRVWRWQENWLIVESSGVSEEGLLSRWLSSISSVISHARTNIVCKEAKVATGCLYKTSCIYCFDEILALE